MNIKEAKTEIANTLRAYHRKDDRGNYLYPINRQRPIFLIGPPGIGKTAVLQQVADQCDVGLVSYTLTHHTRQSAVGLPRIQQRQFEGQEYSVTEYTMSEIIASVYAYMEKTGKREGILFLDEINCVSETLAPTILQLLQNKTFGCHQVPEGWIIVAAGNPPEYNKSVREFDVATLDRVRTIPVEADLQVWLEYARQNRVHGAILSYLTVRPQHFYLVEDGTEGKYFVTARGWEDLSELLKSYEALDVPVTKALVNQFLQKEDVAGAFAAYYQLYRKYRGDYGIPEILKGVLSADALEEKAAMAKNGSFEERFTVVQLLMDGLEVQFDRYARRETYVGALHQKLQIFRNGQSLEQLIETGKKSLQVRKEAGLLENGQEELEKQVLVQLEDYELTLQKAHIRDDRQGFEKVKELFSVQVQELEKLAQETGNQLDRAFRFAESCFGEGQEVVLLVTDLTQSDRAMKYITTYGCPAFVRHQDAMLFEKREKSLMEQCRELLQQD